jgi:glycosyltransferase involved in cell wall biosynthesis
MHPYQDTLLAGLAFASAQSHRLTGRTVLQIIPEMDAGGAERTTVDMAEALSHRGARALVATEGGRLIGELQTKGGVWIPFPAKTKNPFLMMMNARKLMRICLEERVCLIHARSRAPAWVALMAARTLNLPFVTTYHGSYSGKSAIKVLYNSVMARGDRVIANSHYTSDLIMKAYPAAKSRLRVIHRGTDMMVFSPATVSSERVDAIRTQWKLQPHERAVLLAARLTEWKGQKVLIEAARLLKNQGVNDVVFILAGDAQGRTAYVRELDSLITSLGLSECVRHVGHCSDMPAAFLAASVVAVPSTEPEAFGRSAVEAQAMGTPVIVSHLGAVPETVLAPPQVPMGQHTGWHIAPDDALSLSEALREALVMQASARDALARRARLHVEDQFSLERMVDSTLNVYTDLLAG